MRAFFEKDLIESQNVHRPLRIHSEEMRETRCREKKVLDSRMLEPSIGHWQANNQYATLSADTAHVRTQPCSLAFESPAKLDKWMGKYGRIYAVASATRKVEDEDWRRYNRLSFWVYADMPGFRSINLCLQFLNGGEHPLPDLYGREGNHNVNLLDGQWQLVQVEMENIDRDHVTGLRFEYDIVGHEPSACDTARFFIADLTLETVDGVDVYKGCVPGLHRIAYSGSGYQPGSRKTAIVNEPGAETFKVLETATGRVVLEAPVQTVETSVGSLQVMDFTAVSEPGEYLLICGESTSRAFPIGHDVWEDAVWKSLNFLFCERCGFEVPGKHGVCHRDATLTHDGKTLIANGGWHDAGDMTQTTTMTSEMTYALFELLSKLEEGTPLYLRVLEEAKWGLDWVLKTRFGDGYRVPSSSKSCWSDGVIGTDDDVNKEAVLEPIENFMAAGAEAMAARMLQKSDPVLAAYSLRCAKEDWGFGFDNQALNGPVANDDPNRICTPLLMYSAGAWSAVAIYNAGGGEAFRDQAAALGREVMACQQREIPDWNRPLVGFFYDDPEHRIISHYSHRSHEYEPLLALRSLYEAFPEHPEAGEWFYAVRLYADYAQEAYCATAPYHVAPASIYHEDEAFTSENELGFLKRFLTDDERREYYRRMVRTGEPLGGGYYLRRMPVAYAHRGNHAVTLGAGKAVAQAAHLLDDQRLAELSTRQLEWISGRNPFAESVMFGEGYDYCSEYAVLPGEMVGEMGVGFSCWKEEDIPYWPQFNSCVYKEVWIKSTLQWVWLASELIGGARFDGMALPGRGEVRFRHKGLNKTFAFTPDARTGWVEGTLPSGEYEVSFDGRSRAITLLATRAYRLRFPLAELGMEAEREGANVRVTLSAGRDATFRLRAVNLNLPEGEVKLRAGESRTLTASVADARKPWLVLAVPDDEPSERLHVYGR